MQKQNHEQSSPARFLSRMCRSAHALDPGRTLPRGLGTFVLCPVQDDLLGYWGKKTLQLHLFLFMLLFILFFVNVCFTLKLGFPFHFCHRILFKFNIFLCLKDFLLITLKESKLQFGVGCLFPMNLKFEMF